MNKETYIKIVNSGDGYLISGYNSPADCVDFLYALFIHMCAIGFSFEVLRDILNSADVSFHSGSVDAVLNNYISS